MRQAEFHAAIWICIERAVERRFLAHGIRTNAIAAISSGGVVAYQLL